MVNVRGKHYSGIADLLLTQVWMFFATLDCCGVPAAAPGGGGGGGITLGSTVVRKKVSAWKSENTI